LLNPKKSFFPYYSERPDELKHLSLFEVGQNYYFSRGRWVKRKKMAIVRTFPKVHDPISLSYDDLRNQCIFHIPWFDLVQFDISEEDLKEQLRNSNQQQSHIFVDQDDVYVELTDSETDSDYELHDPDTTRIDQSEGELISGQNYTKEQQKYLIGERVEDNDFDWNETSTMFSLDTLEAAHQDIKNLVKEHGEESVDFSKLKSDQQEILDFLECQIEAILKGLIDEDNVSKLTIVQGKAGYGKSFLLTAMTQTCKQRLGKDSYIVVGPTGVSAKNVNGITIHSFARLGRSTTLRNLEAEDLQKFQDLHKNLKFVFVDEYSMVGCKMLGMLEKRCREAKYNNELFGDLHIYLMGDIYQLAPVGDVPLYGTLKKGRNYSIYTYKGKSLIHEFQKAFVLKIPKSFANIHYINFLERLSEGNCDDDDVRMLSRRNLSRLSQEELAKFSKSIKIANTNDIVSDFNNCELKDSKFPIAKISAKNNCKKAFQSSDDKANSLHNILYLTNEARVMLRQNINVNIGLVNGATGTVKHIVFEKDIGPPQLPLFVLVQFDGIVGFKSLNGCIPLKPFLSSWYVDSIRCTRIQIPVSLCWACTIYKSQGLTLKLVQIHLADNESQLGSTYVAFSRVPDVQNLILLRSLNIDRLNSVKRNCQYLERLDFIKFIEHLC